MLNAHRTVWNFVCKRELTSQKSKSEIKIESSGILLSVQRKIPGLDKKKLQKNPKESNPNLNE